MVTSPSARPALRWLALVALVVLALSLRVPISSLGGVLSEVQDTLNLSTATAGLLTTLPVLFFAAVGLGAARAISRAGLHRATIAVLLVMTTASLFRATTSRPVVFIAATALLLAAIAGGNVLLPALAKRHYPHRLASVSSLYGAAVIGGSSLGALAAGVLSSGPGWRAALLATAAVPLVGVLLWAPMLRHDRGAVTAQVHLPVTSMLRSRRAWALAGCFGLVCAQAYAQLGWFPAILVDSGSSTAHAAAMLTLLTAAGIPTILALPVLVRLLGHAGAMVLFGFATATGWLGLLLGPSSADTPVVGPHRHRSRQLRVDDDHDRPARAQPGRSRRTVQLHPRHRFPARRSRPVRCRHPAPGHRYLDRGDGPDARRRTTARRGRDRGVPPLGRRGRSQFR